MSVLGPMPPKELRDKVVEVLKQVGTIPQDADIPDRYDKHSY